MLRPKTLDVEIDEESDYRCDDVLEKGAGVYTDSIRPFKSFSRFDAGGIISPAHPETVPQVPRGDPSWVAVVLIPKTIM